MRPGNARSSVGEPVEMFLASGSTIEAEKPLYIDHTAAFKAAQEIVSEQT
jgi:hypothetical protein